MGLQANSTESGCYGGKTSGLTRNEGLDAEHLF